MGAVRIMTANIWGDYFGNAVSPRDKQLLTVVERYAPLILGLQEATVSWHDSVLLSYLRESYTVIGEAGNYVPLAVHGSCRILADGYEPLIHTPDESKGITWAVADTPEWRVAVCNTHFWWKTGEEHDAIRVENAHQLVARMRALQQAYACPVLAMGDMNCPLSAAVFSVYKQEGVQHLNALAAQPSTVSSHHGNPVRGDDGLYHGCRTDNGNDCSIDHILTLTDDVSVSAYCVVEDQEALDATDHSPVYADITLV